MLELQGLSPNRRHCGLHFTARWLIPAKGVGILFWRRQGFAIQLAVWRQRHPLQPDECRGQHILRQFLQHVRPQLLHAQGVLVLFFRPSIPGRVVRHQLLLVRPQLQHQHCGFLHRLKLPQSCLDLGQFDAVSANLHLAVIASQKLQRAVSAPPHQIPGPIHTRASFHSVSIWNEPFCCQLRPVQIASSKSSAANVKLPGHAHGSKLPIFIQYIQPRVRNTLADERCSFSLLLRTTLRQGIANTRLYVLNEDGQLAPVGVTGELYIGGAGLARGYLNRPELTAERFIPDRYGVEAGARVYRTGDLVRWSGDGALEFLGRNDGQVKIRGHRIELAEIEARLRQLESVKEAAVLVLELRTNQKQLVAYYTTRNGWTEKKDQDPLSVEQLRTHMLEKLPEYMLPAAFVRLERMPLTPNGKLNRKALPSPEEDAYAFRRYEPPCGEMETAVAAIWAEALKLEHVGRYDNFFELGGHSLLAMQAMSRIRKTFAMELPLRVLFAAPTVEALAKQIEQEKRKAIVAAHPAIERARRDRQPPLSFAQRRLWFLTQMAGASKAYQIGRAMRLKGALDVRALRQALDRIVARHESLRTTFTFMDGEPVQQIGPIEGSSFHLVEHDLSQRQDKEPELGRLVIEEADTAFKLETGPLIRGRLIRLGDEEHALLITMHHIVSDGWSQGVLFRELSALYAAYKRGVEDPLPPMEVQYADYAVWQRQWMAGEVLREQGDYWKNGLAGAPVLLELPKDYARPSEMDYRGAVAEGVLDEKLALGGRKS